MKFERSSARGRHPSENLKENVEYFAEYICFNLTKQYIHTSKFPVFFKFARVTLNFKQGFRNQKNNYRPISVLPIILKIFEKLIC